MVRGSWCRRSGVGGGGGGMEASSSSTSSSFVSRKENTLGVGRRLIRRRRRSSRFVLGYLLVLLWCCCGYCSGVLGFVRSSSSSSSSSTTTTTTTTTTDRKSESEQGQEPAQGQGSLFLRTSVAGGGGRDGGAQRGGSSLEFGILARGLGEEIQVVSKEGPSEEDEEEIAGDGEVERRIMRQNADHAEAASPSVENSGVKNDAGQQGESPNKSPQDGQNANQTMEASNDVGTPPEPGKNDTGTTKEDDVPLQERDCQSEPLFADLKAGDGDSGWMLTVNNTGNNELQIKVIAESLNASPAEFSLKNGEGNTVAITLVDKGGGKINITWGLEYCQITVPAHSLPPSQLPGPANLSFIPLTRTGYMLFGGTILFVTILGIAGIWGCVSWRKCAQWPGGGAAKYQELEMSLATVDSLKKDTEEGSISAEGWDEIWEDDEWEDTEAVRSSSNMQTLSSQGLNVRRANKDGWDSAWDD